MASISETGEVWDLIERVGIAGALGALVGIGLVIWIDATTIEGQGLVFWVGFLVTVLVVEVARWGWAWRGSRRSASREKKGGEDGAGVESGKMERLQAENAGEAPEEEGGG